MKGYGEGAKVGAKVGSCFEQQYCLYIEMLIEAEAS